MKNSIIATGTVIGFFLSCLGPNGVGLAESPDPLEQALAVLQEQWSQNARIHAQTQRHLALQQITLSASGDWMALATVKDERDTDERAFDREQQRLHENAQQMRNELCMIGKEEYCDGVNLNKLALAVAVAETENCTTGTGVSKNNCHGIFQCTAGGCAPIHFASKEDSFRAFKSLWMRSYGNRFPTIADARRYVGSDAVEWYQTVVEVYNSR